MVHAEQRIQIRDATQEAHERRRYELLERIYLLSGTDCERVIPVEEMREQFGASGCGDAALVEDLVRLGLLRRVEGRTCCCITRRGVAFMQRQAWRRRSVRGGAHAGSG